MAQKKKCSWIVTDGDYSSYRILAVFSSEELAEEFCEKYNSVEPLFRKASPEQWLIDKMADIEYKETWQTTIALTEGVDNQKKPLTPGTIYITYKGSIEEWQPGQRGYVEYFKGYYSSTTPPRRAKAVSFISQEHANKLAIEAYQAYLRDTKIKRWTDDETS